MPSSIRASSAALRGGLPSRTLSLSPRQRIVLYRELARRNRADEPSNQLTRLFDYQGIDTCAATGLCADRCPVGINTGALIKKLRTDKYRRFVPIARWSADHFAGVTRTARGALGLKGIAGKLLGDKALAGLVNGVRHLSGQRTPAWLPTLPGPSHYRWSPGREAMADPASALWSICRRVPAGYSASRRMPVTAGRGVISAQEGGLPGDSAARHRGALLRHAL